MQAGQSKRKYFVLLALSGFSLLASIAVFAAVGLRINLTESLPLGIYRISAAPGTPYVAFCLTGELGEQALQRAYRPHGSCPDGGAPLLKGIVAAPGDQVTFTPAGIVVNNHLLSNTAPLYRDGAGRSLQPWIFGSTTVQANTFWVASTYNRYSYDSRYYGPINSNQVLFALKPVLTLREN